MRGGAVSVVIPVHDGARYLAEAVESVLAQTDPPGEILVVDDGSTDDSLAVAASFGARVTCLPQAHAGLSAALNHGVERARGAVLAFLDADDLWAKDKLARQLDALDADGEIDAVFAHVEQFVSPELDPGAVPAVPEAVRVAPGYLAGTLLIRAGALRRVGLFDPRWQVGSFLEWYLRARDAGLRTTMRPEVLLRRRRHTGNMVIRERQSYGDYARILRHALDRRRRPSPGAEAGEPLPS
jgi:glycosyltransferase involved in cell wall biosynthesis